MRILILGIDGYIGWPLCLHLTNRGHEIAGIDNFNRRIWVEMVGGQSVTPIPSIYIRKGAYQKLFGKSLNFNHLDLQNYRMLKEVIRDFRPDTIVHLAHQASAPFSMKDIFLSIETQRNNILGTLTLLWVIKETYTDIHLITIGTMGEFGTPNIDIPEGYITIHYKGRKDTLPFPKQPQSYYHASKVANTVNIELACKCWGLRATDVMQGIVYGTRIDEITNDELLTRLDVDHCWGTALNRFCAQAAIGYPLTLYGKGHQKRGFLPLRDSIQCLRILIENPPKRGEYRVINQLQEYYDLTELAKKVIQIADEFGIRAKIKHIKNPRVEAEEHYYNPEYKKLFELGYKPSSNIESELRLMFQDVLKFKKRIKKEAIMPKISWY